jgi:dienelactone hydrolase
MLAISISWCAPQASRAKPVAPSQQYAKWRTEIRHTLFIPDNLPSIEPASSGTFHPAEGVVAERITYATTNGMRVPAIVYRPEKPSHRNMPAIVIVNGHSGDKTSWYAFYSAILYARAGAVVLTYDPLGEDERNSGHRSEAREHDTILPGDDTQRRVAGQMITDILQGVGYLAQRSDIDPRRIAVAAYSMGSFHSAIAGAIDPRIHALLLSGGGNLDGHEGYWDTSKPMCQAGAYRALDFLGDRGAILYALNQQRGPTLVLNGTADKLITSHHTEEAFFIDLRNRTAKITGTRKNLFRTDWFEGAGHRPNFITRRAALWLNEQLRFPNWTAASIATMPEIHINEWAAKTGAHIGQNFQNELSEGGLRALDPTIPNVSREELQALSDSEWQRQKQTLTWTSWIHHLGIQAPATAPVKPLLK